MLDHRVVWLIAALVVAVVIGAAFGVWRSDLEPGRHEGP
jgi:hypothetical protein